MEGPCGFRHDVHGVEVQRLQGTLQETSGRLSISLNKKTPTLPSHDDWCCAHSTFRLHVECSDFSKPIYHVNTIDISKAEMVKAEEGVAGEQVKAEQGAGEKVKTEQAEVDQQLKSQIEFCFSDSNLPKNKFLLQPTKKTPEGWVSLKTISEFKKMRDMGATVRASVLVRISVSRFEN